jgi:putative hemolysin
LAPLLGDSPLAAAFVQRCETLGAYATAQLGQSTSEGAMFVCEGVRFEIIDMDGSRIDKLLVSREEDSP